MCSFFSRLAGVLLLSSVTVFSAYSQSGVKAWEEDLVLPTYVRNAPEQAPIFERTWSYQRARRSVYPYALDDNMTRERKDVAWKAVYLENEYMKVCVLPEIGGRLFYALDKTDNYDIFYHQHVIKPADVGMLGAWISGGVEWNVFHHHRATSMMPVDYKIEECLDGSKTIWIGETEHRHRMQWAIGITLHPGKSYVEISGRLINSTADDNSILYWSNVATASNPDYQIIFPPRTDFVTFHTKSSFAHWPVTHEVFNGLDLYENDVDASWFKNHYGGNSMFVYDQKDDFIAGYDHGVDAGTLLTADHNINKGGKFWLWGPNSEWDSKILTDTDGHYIELMMGAYSDNQPDYSWISPYQVRKFSQYYYGLSKIDGVKAANRRAALNYEPRGDGKYYIGVNSTEVFKNLEVKVSSGERVLYSGKFGVAPDSPYETTVGIDSSLKPYETTITLYDGDGKLLLSYTPRKDSSYDLPLPETVKRPLRPQEIENTEECYLVGLRALQFHNPYLNPEDYFLEVLRRDPDDTRANTKMGVILRKRGLDEEAAVYLRRAIKRLTKDYTRPSDCEALYNLGLILKDRGEKAAAIDTLFRAVWNYNYNSPANYQLAQMFCADADYANAMERLDEAVSSNGNNYSALNLKATVLRVEGIKGEARRCIEEVLRNDPLNAYASYEKDLLDGGTGHVALMRDDPESYLELAIQYVHNGFCDEAVKLLRYIDGKCAYPSVKMWLGYLLDDKSFFEAALGLPVGGCNPFRLETIAVLEKAKELFPQSAKPWYWEGCLLYNKQQDNAAAQWRKAVELDPGMDLAWRNLGWYNWLWTKDYREAAACYAKAVELAPGKPLYLEEYDQVLEAGHEDVRKRFEILTSHHETSLKRYYPIAQEVVTGTYLGEYDYVLSLLDTCYFPTREGVRNFHDIYVDALLVAGKQKEAAGNPAEAVKLYEKAFGYPENHQVFLVDGRTARDAQIYAFIAQAYEKAGQDDEARSAWEKAAAVNVKSSDFRYWKGLALKKLGDKAGAKALFKALVEDGKGSVVDHFVNFFGAEGNTGYTVEGINAKAWYTAGLGELGMGRKSRAKKCFKKSFNLVPENLWTKYMLEEK